MQKYAVGESCASEGVKTVVDISYTCPKCSVHYCYMRLLRPMEMSKMRNPTNIERAVRIRRKIKESQYFDEKRIYKREESS